jgi:hypothetical protein
VGIWAHTSNTARLEQSFREIAEQVKVRGHKDPQAVEQMRYIAMKGLWPVYIHVGTKEWREVTVSGPTQADVFKLVRDWLLTLRL